MIDADHAAAHVRDDEPDPSDNAAGRHRERREDRRRDNGNVADARGIHPEAARLLLAEREDVDAPADRDQERPCGNHGQPDDLDFIKVRLGKAAHQPVGNGGQLVVGVGRVFHQRDERGEDRRDDDAREHERHHRDGAAAAREVVHEPDTRHAADEGDDRGPRARPPEEDAEHSAEASAARDAEHIGTDERIAENALVDSPRERKPRADEHGDERPRQAKLQNDGRCHIRPRIASGRAHENVTDLAGRDRKASRRKRQEKDGDQQDRHGRPESCIVLFHRAAHSCRIILRSASVSVYEKNFS